MKHQEFNTKRLLNIAYGQRLGKRNANNGAIMEIFAVNPNAKVLILKSKGKNITITKDNLQDYLSNKIS